MSKAFEAVDTLNDVQVALKVLRIENEELLLAFRNGFAQLCGLYHPYLCRVHDFGTELGPGGPKHYYTEDYIDGLTLDQFARGVSWEEIAVPLGHTVEALAFLHRLGIRHGDFKEQNILVDKTSRGVLTDFGCTMPFDGPRAHGADLETSVSGTRDYMAPEIFTEGCGDARADLYAVGVTLNKLSKVVELPTSIIRLSRRLTSEAAADRPSDASEVLEAFGVDSSAFDRGPPLGLAPRLIGRADEMGTFMVLLNSLLDERAEARGLIISGPPGIGRTRLLREMKWAAQLRCAVVEGDTEAAIPLMIDRALNERIERDLSSVLNGWRRIAQGVQPSVFILDDAHLLDEHDETLLHAVLRTLEPADRAMLIVGCTSPPEGLGSMTRVLELRPLSEPDIAAWSERIVAPAYLPHLLRLSGGYPSYLEAYLAKLSSGELTEDDLASDMGSAVEPLWQHILNQLADDERTCLGTLAIFDGELGQGDAARLGVSENALLDLHQRGWVTRDGEAWKLTRAADAAAILATLDDAAQQRLHVDAAQILEEELERSRAHDRRSDVVLSQLILHFLSGGLVERALDLLRHRHDDGELSAGDGVVSVEGRETLPWLRVADALVGASERDTPEGASRELLLEASKLFQSAGHPERGLRALELLRRRDSDTETATLCDHQEGACHLKLGNVEPALEHLRRALEGMSRDDERAEVEASLSRALILQGSYVEAIAHVRDVLSSCKNAHTSALLHENLGAASGYLGEIPLARKHLNEAASLHASSGSPRDHVRVVISQSIQAFREGDTTGAIAGYRQALGIAEKHGLSDLLANAALNLGTACQQRGDLGPALVSYERGLRIASSLGKVSTEITLRFNIANLYAVIGLFDRAEGALSRARVSAQKAGLRYFEGATEAVRGEIALARGDFESARGAYMCAREAFERQNAAREIAEVDQQLAEISLTQGDLDQAWNIIEALESEVVSAGATDLLARLRMLRGAVLLERGEASEAIMALDEARELEEKTGQRILGGEIEVLRARASERQGALELADAHRKDARRLWERVAASLPERFRDAFWGHPRRRTGGSRPDETVHSRERLELTRVFEINRRLNSSLSVDKILEHALDAAIEITGAERGFVLLAKEGYDGRLEVPVARNVDRERIGKSHLKFSRGIAEEVIQLGDPVLTVDARQDERFSDHVSVHAMRLSSVACVPIQTPERVVGALYLDNRFARARFRQSDVGLLLAFADQVALALRNAWLVADLEQRTDELEAEKAHVEELMRGQVEELDRLQEEVRTKQEILEYRYDYSNIVGRSPAMRALLASLDRVIDTMLSVLIQGESGTGKELIARAVHFNSPRRDRPFIGVNCAALPDTLLESELFGHIKGAFTGADRNREGLFVAARGGTLFLDELGEMSLSMQSKLLRAIQEREVQPLGSTSITQVDIRLVCATNRILADKVAEGLFRQDLYYRVAVVVLDVPPLRDRLEDVPVLATHLVEQMAQDTNKPACRLSQDALRAMMRYRWPGNVRELENVLAKASVMTSGRAVRASDLELPRGETAAPQRPAKDRDAFERNELQSWVDELNRCRWNISEAARRLGVPRNTIYRRLRRHGIMRPSK